MPVAEAARIEAGVLGLEATHRWEHGLTIPGVLTAPLVLNDPVAWPRYRVRRIGGLHSGPEREGSVDARVGKIGNSGRPTRLGGKSVAYEGTVFGRTLVEMRQARLALLAAFSVLTPRTMRVVPHEDYAGGTEHIYTAIVLTCDCDDVQSLAPTSVPSGFGRDFVLGLRLDDPRTYRPVPVVVAGAVSVAIVNGSAPTDMIVNVAGASDPFTLTGAHGVLVVEGVTGACSIDFARGQIRQGGLAIGRVGAASTWFDAPAALPAGNSTVDVVGAANIEVTYRRAYW